jgi:hypothetical protein
MTRISRLLTIAGCAGVLLTGTAFAQSASNGAMSDHMTSGSMSTMKGGHKSSAAMMSHGHGKMSSDNHMKSDHMKSDHMKSDHMKSDHMKSGKHGKKMSHHMTSGAMSSGH